MPGLVWLVMGVVFLGVEATRGDFYLFGFGLGAIAAALLSFTGLLPVELAAFIAVGFGSAIGLRPTLSSWLRGRPGRSYPDPMQRLNGQQGEVVEAITAARAGAISLNGQHWLAAALDDSDIPVGSTVEVFGVEGTTLTVLPVLEIRDPSGGGRKGVS